jgi:predicted nuclease of predicted toxin-antitoxin system
VRLLLDAQLSGRHLGGPLRRDGHDVVAACEDAGMATRTDPELFRFAADEGRILITCDMDDYPELVNDWAHARLDHAGCILIAGVRNNEYGVILRAVRAKLAEFPDAAEWVNQARYAGRSPA